MDQCNFYVTNGHQHSSLVRKGQVRVLWTKHLVHTPSYYSPRTIVQDRNRPHQSIFYLEPKKKKLQVDLYRAFPFKPDAAPDTPSVIGPVHRPIHCPSDQRDSEHGGLTDWTRSIRNLLRVDTTNRTSCRQALCRIRTADEATDHHLLGSWSYTCDDGEVSEFVHT